MRRLRTLIGMPVVDATSGRRVGRVTRVHIDETLTRLTGLWVSERWGRLFFCPASVVELVGTVSVLVRSVEKHRPEGAPFRLRRAIDASGSLIGAIVGAYVDGETLTIPVLELTRGFWEDLTRGHELVRNFAVRLPAGDVAVGEGDDSEDEDGND